MSGRTVLVVVALLAIICVSGLTQADGRRVSHGGGGERGGRCRKGGERGRARWEVQKMERELGGGGSERGRGRGRGRETSDSAGEEGIRRILATTAAVADANALLKFKESLVDPDEYLDWTASTVSDLCLWSGVTCTKGRVTMLELTDFGLEGPISVELLLLDQLKTLDLSGNSFNGSIPEYIGNLSSLESLNLEGNLLNGFIPETVANLTKLTTLNLGYNNLTGVLPLSIASLSHLEDLRLSGNRLQGSADFLFSVTKLSNLSVLALSYTDFGNIMMPTELGNLTKLSALALFSSNFEGPIPAELSKCTGLTNLVLSENTLSGSVPAEFSKLVNLQLFWLGNTNLTGPISTVFSTLNSLVSVDLSYNQFTGSLPEFVNPSLLTNVVLSNNMFSGIIPAQYGTSMGNLTSLDLSGNKLEGPVPKFSDYPYLELLSLSSNSLNGTINVDFAGLNSLSVLDLSFNDLTGNIPASLADCCSSAGAPLELNLASNQLSGQLRPRIFNGSISLKSVFISDNQFSGPIPSMLKLGYLEDVELQNNQFNGSIPAFGQKSPGFTTFNASGNSLSGQIPSNFLPRKSIVNVDLSNNFLEGEIPTEFGNYTKLAYLRISNNKLSGVIPPSLLNSSSLRTLDLRTNQLTGPISAGSSALSYLNNVYLGENSLNGTLPETLGQMKSLKVVSLENNFFGGSLPTNFSSDSALFTLNLSRNSLTGGIPPLLGQLQNLRALDLSSNSLSGSLPNSIGNLTSLQYLQLEENSLSGQLPAELGNLTNLLVLDISNNEFNGTLPPELAGLRNLEFLNVSSNLLSGHLPGGNLTDFLSSSYVNNSALCGFPLSSCPTSHNLSTAAIVGIAIGSAVCGIFLLAIAFFVIRHIRKYGPDGGELVLYHKIGFPLTYRTILEATGNFSDANLLGVGGFGSVYRATIGDGQLEVAIKRLAAGSGQGLKELRAETKTLGQLRHRNLVTLIGSYISRKEALLIYEFVSGGDLDSYLTGQKKVFSDWQMRHYVLVGAARGFKYLHHDCQPAVIHRDIKPANILLESEMEPRIADFGLAKELDIDTKTHMSTAVSGTVGYLAPEYVLKKRLTPKSDVYAFGVVILQVLTGRRPTDKTIGESGLAAWVSLLWIKRAAMDAVDPNLKLAEHEKGQLLGALKIGLMCTSRKPTDRPTMAQVVHLLENLDLFTSDHMGEVGEEKVEKVVH